MFRSTLRGLGLTMLLALPVCAIAGEAAAPSLAALKGMALDLLQAQPAASAGGLELYIGDIEESLLLRQLTVWIDDAPPLRYDYSDAEALALHQGGLHRFPLPALAPGVHRLRADFAARYTDAPPDYWRAAGSVERKLSLGATPQLLELELVKGSYIGKPELQPHELKLADDGATTAGSFIRGSAADPVVRAAAYLTASDRPMEAALELLHWQAQTSAVVPPDAQLRLAQALAAFGVDDRAEAAYQQALGTSDARLQAEAHLGLAELRFAAGQFGAAQQNAEAVGSGLPREQQMQAQDLQARIALAQGDLAKALALAGQADSAPLIYSRYNLGLALLKSGQAAQGRALLEGIASGSGGDAEAAALRDKVNVALGYEQLRRRTGANAAPLFSRVRSPSPYTGAALLGMGWAMLAPAGKGLGTDADIDFAAPRAAQPGAPYARIPVLLQPALTDDVASWRRAQPYKLNAASPQEEQALRRALVPWVELIGRDPLDPAVQEGAIAIPYALLHIGADDEAQEYFQRAIRLLEAADTQLDAARQGVRGGALTRAFQRSGAANDGWPWWLAVVPREHWWLADDPHQPLAAPDLFYLEHLMDDGRFRQAMQDEHDLWALDEAVAAAGAAEGAISLRARLSTARAATGAQLQELALADLQREQRQVRMYLGEARFALAHLNEPPAGAQP